jgi:hypothetical protein
MVKVQVGEHNYYMDGYLKKNLDIAKTAIKKDWDMVFLVDGAERSGKSVLAMQMAKYCDPSFNISRMAYSAEEFKDYIKKAKKFQAVVYDEAFTGLSGRDAMSHINKSLIEMLAEIGQQNLYVFVVMPTFFDVDKYVALWRSRALVHVYTTDNFKRGSFTFYNFDKKKDLYVNGKKFYSYRHPKPNFWGSFTNYYVVNEEEYRKRKFKALSRRRSTPKDAMSLEDYKKQLFDRLLSLDNFTHKNRYDVLGISKATYYQKLREYNKKVDEKLQIYQIPKEEGLV